MDNITIRRMTAADYDEVFALWLNTPGMGLNKTDDSREGIGKYLARNPGTCFVAERYGTGDSITVCPAESSADDSAIIGVILAGHDGRRGYIHHMAVGVSERGQGIGTALLDAAMTALGGEGITKSALVVFADNHGGNAFWEKRGFTAREDLVYRNRNITELEKI